MNFSHLGVKIDVVSSKIICYCPIHMADVLCKIIKSADVVVMTETGIVPHQPDDLINGHLCLYPRKLLEEARAIYFSGENARAYYIHMNKLDDIGYVVFWQDPTTCVLIGPGDTPTMPIPVECLVSAVLE